MDMNELFSEFIKSNKPMEDNHRPHQRQTIGKLNSYLLDMIREEKELKINRALPKPQSKYHR